MTQEILTGARRKKYEQEAFRLNEEIYHLFEGKALNSSDRHARLDKVARKLEEKLATGAESSRSWVLPLLVIANTLARNPAYKAAAERASRAAAAHAYFDPVIERGAVDVWYGNISRMKPSEKVMIARDVARSSKTNTLFKEVSRGIVLRDLISRRKRKDKEKKPASSGSVTTKRRSTLQARL